MSTPDPYDGWACEGCELPNICCMCEVPKPEPEDETQRLRIEIAGLHGDCQVLEKSRDAWREAAEAHDPMTCIGHHHEQFLAWCDNAKVKLAAARELDGAT